MPTVYSINVQVTDSLGLTFEKPLTFTVLPNAALTPPAQVFVNAAWAGLAIGTDPDGSGAAISFGYDAYATIQQGLNAVAPGGAVYVAGGTYQETLPVSKSVTLEGASSASTVLAGTGTGTGILASGATVNVVGLTIEGFSTGLTAGAVTGSITGGVTSTLNLTDVQLLNDNTGGFLSGLNKVHVYRRQCERDFHGR